MHTIRELTVIGNRLERPPASSERNLFVIAAPYDLCDRKLEGLLS